ncbi:pantetheine-phosphate adenylyltransferase [bacterium]|nr:pantetheine-phosphate adenylyltransferase [bacterium]
MVKNALYPGSFDPITLGHTDVIERCVPMFGKIYIGVGTNTSKHYHYSKEKRVQMLREIYKDNSRVEVVSFDGLTVDLCRQLGCEIIIRGVRSTTDMEYERAIAESNKKLFSEIETILLFSSPEVSSISSSIVRELIRNRADVSRFVPAQILEMIY